MIKISLNHSEWNKFLVKTKKEPITHVKGKFKALKHLDKLKKKG